MNNDNIENFITLLSEKFEEYFINYVKQNTPVFDYTGNTGTVNEQQISVGQNQTFTNATSFSTYDDCTINLSQYAEINSLQKNFNNTYKESMKNINELLVMTDIIDMVDSDKTSIKNNINKINFNNINFDNCQDCKNKIKNNIKSYINDAINNDVKKTNRDYKEYENIKEINVDESINRIKNIFSTNFINEFINSNINYQSIINDNIKSYLSNKISRYVFNKIKSILYNNTDNPDNSKNSGSQLCMQNINLSQNQGLVLRGQIKCIKSTINMSQNGIVTGILDCVKGGPTLKDYLKNDDELKNLFKNTTSTSESLCSVEYIPISECINNSRKFKVKVTKYGNKCDSTIPNDGTILNKSCDNKCYVSDFSDWSMCENNVQYRNRKLKLYNETGDSTEGRTQSFTAYTGYDECPNMVEIKQCTNPEPIKRIPNNYDQEIEEYEPFIFFKNKMIYIYMVLVIIVIFIILSF